MNFVDFLKKYSALPSKFIIDFANIIFTDERYDTTKNNLNFEIVSKWLNVRKQDLKRLLISKFKENIDYTIEKVIVNRDDKTTGATRKELILLNPSTFKHLCMLSRTAKAEEVRLYFLEMERLLHKYYNDIQESLEKQIGILKENQKPKLNIKGGIMYILEAQNNEEKDIKKIKKYKIGKTINAANRLNTYNSGNANDVNPIWIMKTDDIDAVEKCVKAVCESARYRKHKEIYEIDEDVLKKVITDCDILVNNVKKSKNIYVGKLSRSMNKDGNKKIFIKFERDRKVVKNDKSKSRSKGSG